MFEPEISGAQELFGYEISLKDNVACVTLDIKNKHLNRTNTLHGGIISCLLDVACGYTVSMCQGNNDLVPCVTVSLTVNYHANVKSGKVFATATHTGGGRKTVFSNGVLKDENGRTIATATGTFKLLHKKTASHQS